MQVIKASGKKEEFNPEKIRSSFLRAGVDRTISDEVIGQVEKELFDGMTTGAIFKRVMEILKERSPAKASCYDLKEAIMRLRPAGFPFETFIAEILKEHGFQTVLRTKLRGKCVEHEIDVIATDNMGKRYIIECKFHNSPGTYIDLKEALYTYARLLDLNNGNNSFDGAWLSCNTKASTEAQKYAECMNIRLLCWRHGSLEEMIAEKNLYPITILQSAGPDIIKRFSRAGYMLVKDLLQEDFRNIGRKTGLKDRKIRELVDEAKEICC
ncbi:MAG: restriction endonuclease [Candidatus Methanoperedens sp.]|nr:restriction endonuclease [Candidatus Methanoperedens sp.]